MMPQSSVFMTKSSVDRHLSATQLPIR